MSKLSEQRQLVARKAVEVERTRLALKAAQSRFAHSFRRQVVVPGVLLLGFGAGLVFGLGRPGERARLVAETASKLAVPGATLLRQWTALRAGLRARPSTPRMPPSSPRGAP
jgi:hypothetical protein